VANSTTPLRILDLSIYTVGGQKRYSAVAVVNQGAQQQSWWWYFDRTGSEVGQLLQQNNARLIDIELETAPSLNSPARFAVVMVAQNPGANWVYTSLTSTQVNALVSQNGARLTNLHRYTSAIGATRFAVSMVDNANAQTRRVRDYMAAQVTTGSYGFMLKQVNSPVLASLHENFAFEPASTLKILHGAYAIRKCALGARTLDGLIYVPNRCDTEYWNNVCPDIEYSCSPGNEALSTTIRIMLRASHNGRTRTLEDLFGRATLNSFAAQNGGTLNTQINHYIGCGAPPNTTSSFDMTRFYERIANGALFSTTWRDELFALMINLASYGFNGSAFGLLGSIINTEAADTDLTTAERNAFRAAVQSAYKAGGYTYEGLKYSSVAGWVSLPFKVFQGGNWNTVERQYTFASFVHGGASPGDEVAYSTRSEMLREQIREALESWDAACSPGIAQHPGSVTVIPAGTTDAPQALPTHLVMHAPPPNPFNPQVTLRFDLPRSTDLVVLEVFDEAGRRVRTLLTTSLPAGSHSLTWNGTDDAGRKVASGTYLARLRAGSEQATHRLMLVE
jgi:hypothetical protein